MKQEDQGSQSGITCATSTYNNSNNKQALSAASFNDLFTFNPNKRQRSQKKTQTYTDVMIDRWQKTNQNIPDIDKMDLANESPHFSIMQ